MRSSYSRFTRSVSWLLIFAILAMQTVSVPVISRTQASSLDHADLVSIIVDTDTYSGETADLIDRYAEDIQSTENNTRVAIFTVPPSIHPDRVAALNEKLYYEGDGSGLSNLVGTILVGKVPLPVVHADGQAFLSIYPYVDFREKNFLYNETSGKFEKTENDPLDPSPEIWHSVVMPDTGDEAGDRADLKAFFDKTHAFHTSSDQFQPANTENPPYVFYFDGYHDQLATNLVSWKSYQRYMDHQEDFAYSRYNKHLAKQLVEEMQKDTDAELGASGKSLLDSLGQSSALATMNFDLIPDIQSKLIIEKATNPFYRILNAKYIGDILRYAYNSGRYGDANNGRVDIASVMVAKKDELVRETLKSANDLFESMIDEIVKNDVATKAKILDRVTYVVGSGGGDSGGSGESGGSGGGGGESASSSEPPTVLSYKNYFYGTAASDVTDPRQCSITRGSSLMIEANRGYNVMRTEADANKLATDLTMGRCFPGGVPTVLPLWGGNTPINLDTNSASAGISSYRLKSQRYKAFFSPIYDLGGAREIPFVPALTETPVAASTPSLGTDLSSPPSDPAAFGENMALRVASPLDCSDNSLILQPYSYTETSGGGESSSSSTVYYPPETNGTRLSCITDIHAVLAPPSATAFGSCVTSEEIVDGPPWSASGATAPACAGGGGEGGGGSGDSVHIVYEYKTIPSIIYHKSPDEDDLVAASRGVATPSLAIDKDRYTDFLDGDGKYARVDYPNLFRIEIESLDNLNPEYARSRIQAVLDAASAQVNGLAHRAASATPVDFYARLAAKPEALNALVESVIWANLDNATAKYKFILENALDSTSPARTPVADHKNDYEVAYLSSLGDPENMYVKIDPEKNTVTPEIAKIQETAVAYRALRDASNLPGVEGGASFKCGPPDGVMIWAWLPAVFCWIGSLLPPTIEAGSCSSSDLLSLGNAITTAPQGDADRNGVLDAVESVRYGNILLQVQNPTYDYGAQIPMSATIMRDGYRLGYDSTSVVRFDIDTITAYPDGKATLVYDAANPDLDDTSVIDRYVNFRASNVPADMGLAKFAFSSGNADVDLTLSASVTGGGYVANTDAYKVVSNPVSIRIRSERLDVVSRTRADAESAFEVDSSLAAGNPYGINFTVERRNLRNDSVAFAGALTYRVYDENDRLVSGESPRPIAGNTLQFDDSAVLRKSGTYRFEFSDADGLAGTSEITVLPAPVASLSVNLSTSVFVKGQPVQALVRPLDAYGNVVMGDLVTIEASAQGTAKFSQTDQNGVETRTATQSIDTVEGYYAFEIRSDEAGETLLKFRDPAANVETALIPLRAIDSARLSMTIDDPDTVVVGKEAHNVSLKVVGADGAPISGYNGIVALEFPKTSGVFSPAFVQVIDGVNHSPVIFTPAYVAGENISVTATLPGVADTGSPRVTVRPDVPMETSLAFDRTSVEADSDDSLSLRATLYDRYGNIATGHPAMTAKFDIDPQYRKFARFDGNAFSASATFARGVASVRVHPTMLPGAAYVRVTADPTISGNTFTVTDTTGTVLTAHGVSENVARFDSYYFYNREKLEAGRYNALYTVLGGAAYADVTHGNSLGNAIIFRPDSRSLAVTGLVNSPFANDWLFSLTPAGQYRERTGDASIGLETTVSVRDGHLGFTWYDSTIREHIADADIVPTDSTTALVACQNADPALCSVPTSGRYAIMSAGNASVRVTGDANRLSMTAGSRTLVSLDPSLGFTVDPTVRLVPDTTREGNLLWFVVEANNQAVGRLGLALSGVALGADESGDIRVTPVSDRYGSERTYLGNSSRAERGVRFFRIDTTRDQIDAVRSGPFASGLENATKEAGIGWEGDNTFLLEFSSGESMGEATRLHSSYSTLNLGDPFARLPKIANPNGSPFDQTIGKRLLDTGEDVESAEKIDFNHDATDDLVVFLGSGRIRLFANYSGNLKDMGYLAAVADAGKNRKGVGDFTGDGYADIAGVDKNGKLFLLDNIRGRFVRSDPSFVDATGQTAEIRGAVTSLHVYDMDRDGRDDIVTVDDSGELSILYGREDGKFEKLVVSHDFAVKLTGQVLSSGGAVYYDGLHQLPPSYDPATLQAEATDTLANADNPDGAFQGVVLKNLIDQEIFYQDESYETTEPAREPTLSDWTSAAGTDDSGGANTSVGVDSLAAMRSIQDRGGTTNLSVTPTRTSSRTYIRSAFSEGAGMKSQKRVTDINGEALQSGDPVAVELKITNSGRTPKNNIEYLDSIDRSVLKTGGDLNYTIDRADGTQTTGTLESLVRGSFDLSFAVGTLAPGETATIRYRLVARSIGYAEVVVGDIEPATPYGEIATRANNLCGADYSIWRPVEPYPRTYQAGTLSLSGTEELPAAVDENFADSDGDGTPDIMEMMADPTGNASQLQDYAKDKFNDYLDEAETDAKSMARTPPLFKNTGGGSFQMGGAGDGGFDSLNQKIDDIVEGLGCGFGGGSCLALPLNWAPLAPGTAPTALGFPLGSLTPSTGIPIFSGLTGIPSVIGCIPSVWPVSPLGWTPSPTCGTPSAGGYLGTWNPTNFFRLYVTPTLTLGMGVAACFGGPAAVAGRIPPPGVSPAVPGGNCIIAARPLFSCSDDGSDGNAGRLSLPNNGYTNANSCRADESTLSASQRDALSSATRSYLEGGRSAPSSLLTDAMSQGSLKQLSNQPMVGVGLGTGAEPNFEVSIDTDAILNFDVGNIVKISQIRIPAFPDFLMEWATRQLEEIFNKLTSLPTLYIILPDFSGLRTSDWANFPSKLMQTYDSAADSSKGVGNLSVGGADSSSETVRDAAGSVNSALSSAQPTVDRIGRNVSGIKAAYEFMSNLPLIQIEPEQYTVRVPWISPEDIDKWLVHAELTYAQWKAEIARAKAAWGKMDNGEAILNQVDLQTGPTLSSLERNIRTIQEYKNFPDKLLKYLKYKEIYAEQILCNIEAIEFMLGGWLADNAKRFKTWVELYLLIKSLLKSWQVIIDFFVDLDSECGVCRNERFDLKHFLFKILSGIIPSPPIIRFPKWPDIILDLHNIRAGLRIPIPEIDIRIVPLTLPQLPKLALPDVPTASIGLPSLPQLPQIPQLPDLPDLPSLPLIDLPDLPPPPKIPKLFGAIAAVLDILRLIGKILCLLRLNPFAPEWRAGDIIAQLTERQGTLPLDFLSLEFPEFSMSFIDAIKVTSKVNLEFEMDFIMAMMTAALEPLNSFTNDLSNATKMDFKNVDLRGIVPEHIDASVELDGTTNVDGLEDVGKVPTRLQGMAPFVPVDAATGAPLYSTGSVVAWTRVMQIGMPRLLSALDTSMKTETSMEEFRSALTESQKILAASDHPKFREVAAILAEGLEQSRNPVDTVTDAARKRNQEKFDLVREYVRRYRADNQRDIAEINDVIRGKKELTDTDVVHSDKTGIVKTSAPDARKYADITDRLEEINSEIGAPLRKILDPESDPDMAELDALADKALAPLRNLALADTTVRDSAPMERVVQAAATQELDANNLTSNYRYNYNGIYYKTPAGKQTRLFNYTEQLTGAERVEEFDPDMDGDQDLVYVMDDAVFVKENHTAEPTPRHRSEAVRTRTLTSFLDAGHGRSIGYRAPDYFLEDFAASGQINASFLAADPRAESRYRLEMYPYIDRFDRIASGEVERGIEPASIKESVDLVPDLSDRLVDEDVEIPGGSAQHAYATVISAVGDFTVGGVEYETVERGERITLRAGSRLYSRLDSVRVFVRPDADSTETEYVLPARRSLGFDETMEVRVAEGSLVLARSKIYSPVKMSGDQLRGMPIVPGMRIQTPSGGRLMIEYSDGARSVFDTPSVYECQSLGTRDGDYSFSLSRANKFYYARLAAFDAGGFGTWANLTLLAPQIAADDEPPTLYVADTLRVPVYQSRTLSLRDQISDASNIVSVSYDLDTTVDSDNDGDPTDDRDTFAATPTLPIRTHEDPEHVYDVDLGPFDTLVTKTIRLHVVDAAGNRAMRDVTLEVYAPIPAISGRNAEGAVMGGLNESLVNEPVDLVRERDGYLSRISPVAGTGSVVGTGGVLTGTGGSYLYIPGTGTGAAVWDGDTIVARIDEAKGSIQPEAGYRVGVEPKDATHDRMAFVLLANGDTDPVYRQRLELPTNTSVVSVTDFGGVSGQAVYVRAVDPLSRYAANGPDAPSLPSGGFFIDRDARAVFGLDATAAIVGLRSDASYAYSERDGYPLVTVIVAGSPVAEIWYRIPFAYAVR